MDKRQSHGTKTEQQTKLKMREMLARIHMWMMLLPFHINIPGSRPHGDETQHLPGQNKCLLRRG